MLKIRGMALCIGTLKSAVTRVPGPRLFIKVYLAIISSPSNLPIISFGGKPERKGEKDRYREAATIVVARLLVRGSPRI